MEIFDNIETLNDESSNEEFFSVDVDIMSVDQIEGVRDVIIDLIQGKIEAYASANNIPHDSEILKPVILLKFEIRKITSIYLDQTLSSVDKNMQINEIVIRAYSTIFDVLGQIQSGGNRGLK